MKQESQVKQTKILSQINFLKAEKYFYSILTDFYSNYFLTLKIIIKNQRQTSMNQDQFQRIFDEFSYSQHVHSHESINFEKQFGNLIYFNFQQHEPPKTTLSDNAHKPHSNQNEDLDTFSLKKQQPIDQKVTLNHVVQDDMLVSVEPTAKSRSSRPTSKPSKPRNKSKTSSKRRKNQYDKNIFGNIAKTIIKQILSGTYQEEIRDYCLIMDVDFKAFLENFSNMDRQGISIGTSKLHSFLHSSKLPLGIRKVFSYFFVRYLRDEYVRYVVLEGRMDKKEKYLRCASKMMYIPRLTRNQYQMLSEVVRQQNL